MTAPTTDVVLGADVDGWRVRALLRRFEKAWRDAERDHDATYFAMQRALGPHAHWRNGGRPDHCARCHHEVGMSHPREAFRATTLAAWRVIVDTFDVEGADPLLRWLIQRVNVQWAPTNAPHPQSEELRVAALLPSTFDALEQWSAREGHCSTWGRSVRAAERAGVIPPVGDDVTDRWVARWSFAPTSERDYG